MQRLPYSIRCVLYSQQIKPTVHQAHTGFDLPREQPEGALGIHRALILKFHVVGFIKPVFQVGDHAPEHLKGLPLGGDNTIPVNAAFQGQQGFIKLHFRPVRAGIPLIQPAAEGHRAALDHMCLRVVEAIAVQVGGIQKICGGIRSRV